MRAGGVHGVLCGAGHGQRRRPAEPGPDRAEPVQRGDGHRPGHRRPDRVRHPPLLQQPPDVGGPGADPRVPAVRVHLHRGQGFLHRAGLQPQAHRGRDDQRIYRAHLQLPAGRIHHRAAADQKPHRGRQRQRHRGRAAQAAGDLPRLHPLPQLLQGDHPGSLPEHHQLHRHHPGRPDRFAGVFWQGSRSADPLGMCHHRFHHQKPHQLQPPHQPRKPDQPPQFCPL